MSDTKSILVAISDEELRKSTVESIRAQGFRVISASSGNEARLKFENESFVLVLMEMELRGFKVKTWLESVRKKEELKNVKDHVPVLMLSDKPDVFALHYATFDNVKYLPDYFSPEELKEKIDEMMKGPSQIQKNSKTIKSGDFLIKEGGTSHEMFWILSGSFEIKKKSAAGDDIIIGRIQPGELVGEMSFLDNLPRSASVQALEDSEVLVIPHKKFLDILEGQPRWFRSLMQTLSQRLRDANKRIAGE